MPAIGVHHLEGHLLAPLLEAEPPPFPHVALLVSGGHTLLIEVGGVGRYRVLGASRDDAAGEAFDKSAKLLGLPYPGGPQLAQLAADGRAARVAFPRPMLDRPGLEFSFSGLKTAVLHAVRARPLDEQARADLARGVEEAIVDTLIAKALRALEQTGLAVLVVSGGVSANTRLRERLSAARRRQGARVYYPRIEFSTDNAAMIAVAGLARLKAGEHEGLAIPARAQWPLESLRSRRHHRPDPHRRPHLPARPHRRMHHRLHRVGAARQADHRARHRDAGGLPPRRRSDEVADTLDYKKVAKRVLAFVEASEFKLVETLAHRLALLMLEEFGARMGAHLRQQARRHPPLARRRRGHRAHARRLPRPRRS